MLFDRAGCISHVSGASLWVRLASGAAVRRLIASLTCEGGRGGMKWMESRTGRVFVLRLTQGEAFDATIGVRCP